MEGQNGARGQTEKTRIKSRKNRRGFTTFRRYKREKEPWMSSERKKKNVFSERLGQCLRKEGAVIGKKSSI